MMHECSILDSMMYVDLIRVFPTNEDFVLVSMVYAVVVCVPIMYAGLI